MSKQHHPISIYKQWNEELHTRSYSFSQTNIYEPIIGREAGEVGFIFNIPSAVMEWEVDEVEDELSELLQIFKGSEGWAVTSGRVRNAELHVRFRPPPH